MREAGRTWTLRGLDRRGRVVALAVAASIALPYVAAVLRARSAGWLPSGDAGMIGLFARDVLHGPLPLVGTPTTADISGNGPVVNHPGPIEFYALALPMLVLGSTTGMLVWTVAVNLASALVATWVVFRRLGPSVGLWAALVIGGVAWSQGPAALVDPINSDAGAVALLTLVVLAWAVACGDRRLLPLLAVWSAYYSQLHLGNLPIGLAITGWALAVVLVRWILGRSRRGAAPEPIAEQVTADEQRGEPTAVPAGAPPAERRERWWPWLLGAFAVSAILWAPVIVDAVTGEPSNLRATWAYSRVSDRQAQGWSSALRQAGRALDPRPLVLRTGVGVGDFVRPLSALDVALAVTVVGILVAIAISWRRRSLVISLLAWTSLVLAAAGTVAAARVPRVGIIRLGFYRWTFLLSAVVAIVLGAAVIELVRDARERGGGPSVRAIAAVRSVAVACVALLALAATFVATPVHGREDVVWGMERRVSDVVLPAVDGKANVHIVPFGTLAARSLAMPLALELESHGHHVTVPAYEGRNYGPHRSPKERAPDVVLVLTSSLGPRAPGPGRLLVRASADPVSRDALDALAEQARSAPVAISPNGDAMAANVGLDPSELRLWVQGMAKDPARRFTSRAALRLFADGYLTSPRLDPEALETLLERGAPTLWKQDTVQVTLLTPEQFESQYGPIE